MIVEYRSEHPDESFCTLLLYKILNGQAEIAVGVWDFPNFQSVSEDEIPSIVTEKIIEILKANNQDTVYELTGSENDFGIKFGSRENGEGDWSEESPYITHTLDCINFLKDVGIKIKSYNPIKDEVVDFD